MKILAIIMLLFVVGCSKSYTEKTHQFELPDELRGCKIYHLSSDQGATLWVVRCPASVAGVTYPTGKTRSYSLTFDGDGRPVVNEQ